MTITVGIYTPTDGRAEAIASMASAGPIRKLIDCMPNWRWMELDVGDVESGALLSRQIDILVLPGGEPARMRHSLSAKAKEQIQQWKQQPSAKGLLGICAGAVVACGNGRKGIDLVHGVRLVDDNRFGAAGLSEMVKVRMQQSVAGGDPKESVLQMPYVSGPVFAVQEESDRVWVLGTYETDVAAKRATIMSDTTVKANHSRKKTNNAHWVCSICTRHYAKTTKECCCESRREHVKQWKLMEQLQGVMPGKAAVVAVDDNSNQFRAVLFGPHPEMGNTACTNLLRNCMKWSAEQLCNEE